MRFTWDEMKNKINIKDHGISFETAREVFLDPLHLSILDERFDFFEERWITVGTAQNRAVVVVAHLYFTDDAEEVIRIISAREATSKERKQYETYG
jgi:uncharacterized DUF497 family protein